MPLPLTLAVHAVAITVRSHHRLAQRHHAAADSGSVCGNGETGFAANGYVTTIVPLEAGEGIALAMLSTGASVTSFLSVIDAGSDSPDVSTGGRLR